jgi:hypothetical protein
MADRSDFVTNAQEILAAASPELAAKPAFQSVFTPGLQFGAACKEHLDAAGWERFNAAILRYTGQKGPPAESSNDGTDIFDEVRTECRALLEGRGDLQAQWDEVYGPREKWQMVYDAVQLSKRMVEEQAKACTA